MRSSAAVRKAINTNVQQFTTWEQIYNHCAIRYAYICQREREMDTGSRDTIIRNWKADCHYAWTLNYTTFLKFKVQSNNIYNSDTEEYKKYVRQIALLDGLKAKQELKEAHEDYIKKMMRTQKQQEKPLTSTASTNMDAKHANLTIAAAKDAKGEGLTEWKQQIDNCMSHYNSLVAILSSADEDILNQKLRDARNAYYYASSLNRCGEAIAKAEYHKKSDPSFQLSQSQHDKYYDEYLSHYKQYSVRYDELKVLDTKLDLISYDISLEEERRNFKARETDMQLKGLVPVPKTVVFSPETAIVAAPKTVAAPTVAVAVAASAAATAPSIAAVVTPAATQTIAQVPNATVATALASEPRIVSVIKTTERRIDIELADGTVIPSVLREATETTARPIAIELRDGTVIPTTLIETKQVPVPTTAPKPTAAPPVPASTTAITTTQSDRKQTLTTGSGSSRSASQNNIKLRGVTTAAVTSALVELSSLSNNDVDSNASVTQPLVPPNTSTSEQKKPPAATPANKSSSTSSAKPPAKPKRRFSLSDDNDPTKPLLLNEQSSSASENMQTYRT